MKMITKGMIRIKMKKWCKIQVKRNKIMMESARINLIKISKLIKKIQTQNKKIKTTR